MKIHPDASLLPRPGDVAGEVQDRIDATFAEMWEGAVLEVPCTDIDVMCDLAGRALLAGRRIVDPFEPWTPARSRLLIENRMLEPARPVVPDRV